MPIKFISRNSDFCNIASSNGFETYDVLVEKYIPTKKTFYVSPANSLCFMDGGIDYSLSRNIMPGIESVVKQIVNNFGKTNLLGRKYLPIGSSIIIDYDDNKSLIVAPTMLLPQNISSTHNVFYSTMAVLYNLTNIYGESIDNVDVVMTSAGCGYGKMTPSESFNQIINGIEKYNQYIPEYVNQNYGVLICEPNLQQQPKYYQNTEWLNIPKNEIVKC